MPETAPISCLERSCDLRSFMSSIISKGFTGESDLALIGPSITWLRRPSAHLRKAGAKAGSPKRTLRTASCSLLLRSTPIVKKMQAQTRPANSAAQVGCWFCEPSSNCGSPKRSRPAKTSSASLLTRTRPGSPLLLELLRFTRTHTLTHTHKASSGSPLFIVCNLFFPLLFFQRSINSV